MTPKEGCQGRQGLLNCFRDQQEEQQASSQVLEDEVPRPLQYTVMDRHPAG